MSKKKNKPHQNNNSGKHIPSGSKSVHSEYDNSTEDGFKPSNYEEEE